MLDLLIGPAKDFLQLGIDEFRKRKEYKNLIIAIQDRIRREVRFNIAVLDELLKISDDHDDGQYEALVRSLRTDGFDQIDSGMLPLKIFFAEEVAESVWPKGGFTEGEIKQFKGRLKSIKTQYNLLERLYHRIRLAQTFVDLGTVKSDMKYVQFILRAFERSIASTEL